MANYALRVPESALTTEAFFRERQARGDLSAFDDWLGPTGGSE